MSSDGKINHDLEEINSSAVAATITISFILIAVIVIVSFFYFRATQSQELDKKQAPVNMSLRNDVQQAENKVWNSSKISVDDAIKNVVEQYN